MLCYFMLTYHEDLNNKVEHIVISEIGFESTTGDKKRVPNVICMYICRGEKI